MIILLLLVDFVLFVAVHNLVEDHMAIVYKVGIAFMALIHVIYFFLG